MSRWMVEARVMSLHCRIVDAESPDEAAMKADAEGWGVETLNEWESVQIVTVMEEDEENKE